MLDEKLANNSHVPSTFIPERLGTLHIYLDTTLDSLEEVLEVENMFVPLKVHLSERKVKPFAPLHPTNYQVKVNIQDFLINP